MRLAIRLAAGALALAGLGTARANPFPDERAVPKDALTAMVDHTTAAPVAQILADAPLVLRVRLDWDQASDTFALADSVIENSGTDALVRRSQHRDPLGSYVASLTPEGAASPQSWAAIGTGSEYRRLTRSLTFRFPAPAGLTQLRVLAENPESGAMEEVVSEWIDPAQVRRSIVTPELLAQRGIETRTVRAASASPVLYFNVYADGYTAARKAQFWQDASRAVDSLINNNWPGSEHFEFRAVFGPSRQTLGAARDLGLPVQERDSFLGLYFPYWRTGFRWYNVLYPTREGRFRDGLANVPYDHPLVIVDDSAYWGIGNFNEMTAIPARNGSFTYLLLHEMGHYFGLNEEYEGGGPTELGFAPGIEEPWSQNITFLDDPHALKWNRFVREGTPIPTPRSVWRGNGPYGAYVGGYADSEPRGRSHKPGFQCIMESGSTFCPVCRDALQERVTFDLSAGGS